MAAVCGSPATRPCLPPPSHRGDAVRVVGSMSKVASFMPHLPDGEWRTVDRPPGLTEVESVARAWGPDLGVPVFDPKKRRLVRCEEQRQQEKPLKLRCPARVAADAEMKDLGLVLGGVHPEVQQAAERPHIQSSNWELPWVVGDSPAHPPSRGQHEDGETDRWRLCVVKCQRECWKGPGPPRTGQRRNDIGCPIARALLRVGDTVPTGGVEGRAEWRGLDAFRLDPQRQRSTVASRVGQHASPSQ
jgi:hypothetical protein